MKENIDNYKQQPIKDFLRLPPAQGDSKRAKDIKNAQKLQTMDDLDQFCNTLIYE